MSALRIAISLAWVFFWLYWLVSASRVKRGSRPRRSRPPGLLIGPLVFVLVRFSKASELAVHSHVLEAVGALLLFGGLGFAVWARIHLGRNWGMPMTRKDEPELITSGPYRLVRHPIYSGILLALLVTSLATNAFLLVACVAMGAYFTYSATVEERLLASSFPAAYAAYRTRTKMLIPFLL